MTSTSTSENASIVRTLVRFVLRQFDCAIYSYRLCILVLSCHLLIYRHLSIGTSELGGLSSFLLRVSGVSTRRTSRNRDSIARNLLQAGTASKETGQFPEGSCLRRQVSVMGENEGASSSVSKRAEGRGQMHSSFWRVRIIGASYNNQYNSHQKM